MRHLFTLLLATAFALPIAAQQEDSAAVTTNTSTVDSLTQRITQLENKVSDIHEDMKFNDIWKRNKYISLKTGSQTLEDKDNGGKFKSDLLVGFEWDWFHIAFHKKPIAKMVKIGFDIALDVNYAKYKDTMEADEDDSEGGDTDRGDFDMMQVDGGFSLGPIVEVAPFSLTEGAARHLKAFVYYHMIPSYSGLILDSEVYSAFNLFQSFGIGVTYKAISLGYEYRGGTAKYNTLDIEESVENAGLTNSDEKTKYKTSSNRVFLRINF